MLMHGRNIRHSFKVRNVQDVEFNDWLYTVMTDYNKQNNQKQNQHHYDIILYISDWK